MIKEMENQLEILLHKNINETFKEKNDFRYNY